jgi:hypothetical protein
LDNWAEETKSNRYFSTEIPKSAEPPSGKRLLRFQRLVTAGDDSTYLLTAYLAWEFLTLFFATHRKIVVQNHDITLSYRIGLVICHDHAPVHRVRELAHELGELARSDNEEIKNPIAYEILKSFDLVGPSLKDYRNLRVQGRIPASALVLDGMQLEGTFGRLKSLSDRLPFSRAKDSSRWEKLWEDFAIYPFEAFHLSQLRDFIFQPDDRA